MSPRHQFRMHYPEEARKLDEGYAEFGIVVLNSISYIVKDVIVPFFVPSLKKTNNPDKDK